MHGSVIMIKSNYYAVLAGICASGGGLFGKLSGLAYESYGVVQAGGCIAMMITLNAAMWANFSKALKLSSTSIGPTIVSSAINYILSGVFGVVIFKERTGLLWWSGIGIILIGLILIFRATKHSS